MTGVFVFEEERSGSHARHKATNLILMNGMTLISSLGYIGFCWICLVPRTSHGDEM